MPALLTVNGWELPIMDGAFKVTDVEIGSRSGAYSGASRDARRAIGKQITCTVALQTDLLSEPLEDLIRGRGHHFPFDTTLFADGTGVGPESGYSAVLGSAAPAPKYGTQRLQVTSASSISWIVDAPYDAASGSGSFTLMWWFYNGASWDHYIYSESPSGAALYKNGAYDSAGLTGNVTATVNSDGELTVTLEGQNVAGANATAYYDDLVILPFALDVNADGVVTAAMTGFYSAGRAFSAMPLLDVGGAWYRANTFGPMPMVGSVTGVGYNQGSINGQWHQTLRTVDITLTEAAPRR